MNIRNFINLVEAPISDIEVHGNPLDQKGSFGEIDRKLMNRNIIKGIYKQKLKNIPFDLFIYILNKSPFEEFAKIMPEQEIGESFFSLLKKYENKYWHWTNEHVDLINEIEPILQAIEINKKKEHNAIHFVIADNYTDTGSFPLTPWVMIHRFVHALISGSTTPDVLRGVDFLDMMNCLTFKSARNHSIPDPTELEAEIATQYIVTGKVPLDLKLIRSEETKITIVSNVNQFTKFISSAIAKAHGKAYFI